MNIVKIQDNYNDKRSKADRYFDESTLKRFYISFRPSVDVPKNFLNESSSVDSTTLKYHLKGFQFGNWLTTEDRAEYLAAMYICLYDLQKVLLFKNNNVGLDQRLAITFGSRGVPKALAHFEPYSNVINLSRYKRVAGVSKEMLFKNTGGIGSFAHEYGHFLDAVFGRLVEPHKDYAWLTGDSKSISRKKIEFDKRKYPLRWIMEEILEGVFYYRGKSSEYNEKLLATKSKYLNSRVEIWARLFEKYVNYKLTRLNVKNTFLTKSKYTSEVYLSDIELKRVLPLIDELMVEMRKLIK